jgi:hypothetical protein
VILGWLDAVYHLAPPPCLVRSDFVTLMGQSPLPHRIWPFRGYRHPLAFMTSLPKGIWARRSDCGSCVPQS